MIIFINCNLVYTQLQCLRTIHIIKHVHQKQNTVQYKNNPQNNTQKTNSNTEQYNVTEQHRTLNTQHRKQSRSDK
jgi:hypothetical protein